MKEQEITFREYTFTAISGNIYNPIFKNNKWYIVNTMFDYSLSDIAQLCQIPNDEVVILKLKYVG